jgi:hypothetical protein
VLCVVLNVASVTNTCHETAVNATGMYQGYASEIRIQLRITTEVWARCSSWMNYINGEKGL